LFGNASASDFWNAQADVSHKPVDKILSDYVTEAGEPGLHFSQPHNGSVQVSQQRFYLNSAVKPEGQQTWTIPVCFAVSNAAAKCDVLSAAQGTLRYPSSGLFFPDAGGRGYYRFALPNDVYAKVLAGVETELTPEERIALLGNVWAGVRANYDGVGDYLHLAEAVKDDSSAAVVHTATAPLRNIDERIATTPAEHEALAKWVVKTYKPAYERLGAPSPTDSPNTRELRSALFGVLGNLGKDPDIIAESKKIAGQYLSNPGSVDPDLAQVSAAIAAENGDAAFFDQLQHAFETANNPQIQDYALRLLALFRDPALQKRSLEFAGKVRNQDAIFQLLIPMQFPQTREIAWDFIRNNWDQVKAQLTTWMGGYLVGGSGSFCSEEKKQQVVDFFSTHKVTASDVALQRAKDAIDDCVQLRTTQGPKLQQWASE
jgi:aminopeptidase N/puromycin-sensitive aminopeptidase